MTKTRELRLRRQSEALEAEGHRPGAAGLDPRAALAGWRRRVRPVAARLPHRHSAQGEAAGAEERPECAGPRGRRARGRAARLPGAEDVAAGRAARQPGRRRAEGAGPHGRAQRQRLPQRAQPAERRSHGVSRGVGLRHPLVGCGRGRGGRAHRGDAGAAGGGDRGGEGGAGDEKPRRAAAAKPAAKAKKPKAEKPKAEKKPAAKAKAAKKTTAKKSATKPAKKSAPKKKGSK